METAGIIVLLLFLIFGTLATIATFRTARAVRRSVARGSAQARRIVQDTQLKARSYTMPGPAGELAQMRLALRTSIDATYEALGDDPSLSEAVALLDRLSEHARGLDGELKLLEREPDKGRMATRLSALAPRVERITHSADSLRWATQDRVHHGNDEDLASLTEQIDIESAALRHWAPTTEPPKLSP